MILGHPGGVTQYCSQDFTLGILANIIRVEIFVTMALKILIFWWLVVLVHPDTTMIKNYFPCKVYLLYIK